MSMKETLKKLVATGEIEEAMRVLLDFLEKSTPPNPLLNTAISLSSRYNQSQQQLLQDSETSKQESNQIINTLLELIERIEEVQPDKVSVDANQEDMMVQKLTTQLGLDSPQLATLLILLGESSYEWRKQLTLMGKTGWSADELEELASRYPNYIRRQQQSSNIIFYAMQPAYKARVKQLIAKG